MIWLSIDNLFAIMSNGAEFEQGKWVIFILGAAKIIDLATGVNNSIIGLSRHYTFNLWAILLLAILNIVDNWLLIPKMGLEGAALATLISLFVFNSVKCIFLWVKFKMQPFTSKSMWVLCIGLLVYLIVSQIPYILNPIVDTVVRSFSVVSLFGGTVLYFKLSKDLNNLWNDIVRILPKRS